MPQKKEATYSHFSEATYVFMDADYNQYQVDCEHVGNAVNYLEDGMGCELVFDNGKAIAVELPATILREVTYTEPSLKGDDRESGKVMKPAKIATGFGILVPQFVEIGDKVEIDTRTGEYRGCRN